MEIENEIPEIKCESAKDFLRELDETHSRWRDSTWIYRGQNDASWLLHPHAMRSCFITNFVESNLEQYLDRSLLDGNGKTYWSDKPDDLYRRHVKLVLHIVIEREIVQAFKDLADRVILDIPIDRFAMIADDHDRPTLRDTIVKQINSDGVGHRPSTVAYALAQHHGVPTRLLDWTYRPLYAAFFAAHTVESPSKTVARIVVLAFKLSSLNNTELRVVTHLRSQIGFLQSQDGIFLYDGEADKKYMDYGKWQPFEFELAKTGSVYKLTLPYSERRELLKLLRLKRISKPFLMPSFDNVAEEIMEKRIDWQSINFG